MVKLEFYDPSGTVETARQSAPRLDSMQGKRIGFISGEQWQAHRVLPEIRRMLVEDFPDIEVLPVDAFPQGFQSIVKDETAALVKESGVDAVIIGNAA